MNGRTRRNCDRGYPPQTITLMLGYEEIWRDCEEIHEGMRKYILATKATTAKKYALDQYKKSSGLKTLYDV